MQRKVIIIFILVFAVKWYVSWYINGEISITFNGKSIPVSECKMKSITDVTDEGKRLEWKFGESDEKLTYSVTEGTYGLYCFELEIPQSLISAGSEDEFMEYQFCLWANNSSKQNIDVDIQITEIDGMYTTQVRMKSHFDEAVYNQEIISNGKYKVEVGFGP